MDKFNLEIKNFRRINEANIEINKINVVGGTNGSGKSTASKILYCFLKANSFNREKYILPKMISNLNILIKDVDHPDEERYDIPNKLDKTASMEDVLKVCKNYETKFLEFKNSIDESHFSYPKLNFIEFILNGLENDGGILSSYIVSSFLNDESLISFLEDSFKDKYGEYNYMKFKSESIESIVSNNIIVNENEEINVDCEDDDFYYFTEGSTDKINEVFYMGSVSIFDLDIFINSPEISVSNPHFQYEEHTAYLISNMNNSDFNSPLPNKVFEIQKRINSMIDGNFCNSPFVYEFSFSQEGNDDIHPVNISSGIKQIGIIQMLLQNNKLTPNTFLIIDEPEVNLHPDWQFKFAEILVILAKELDINVYLNSHSPTFIESINAFVEFYDMEDEINYYMTEESENVDKYNFIKIHSNELYKLYTNLGNVYDKINKLRIRKRLNRR